MSKATHVVGIAFWGIGIAVAIADMIIRPGEFTGKDVVLLLLIPGFLALSIWVVWHEWLMNDKGIWDKLKKAIEKDKPELAARCIRSVL